jgi:hypothetical protein
VNIVTFKKGPKQSITGPCRVQYIHRIYGGGKKKNSAEKAVRN